jgi:hypothetical protein
MAWRIIGKSIIIRLRLIIQIKRVEYEKIKRDEGWRGLDYVIIK